MSFPIYKDPIATLKNWATTLNFMRGFIEKEKRSVLAVDQRTDKRWIDGQEIFRAIIKFDKLPNATNKDIPNPIRSYKEVTALYGVAQDVGASGGTPTGTALSIPHSDPTSLTFAIGLYLNFDIISIFTSTNYSDYHAYVFVEYTRR